MSGNLMQRCEAYELNRDVRSVLMKKPTNDYKKLKKQEGALKLVGGVRANFEGVVGIIINYFFPIFMKYGITKKYKI